MKKRKIVFLSLLLSGVVIYSAFLYVSTQTYAAGGEFGGKIVMAQFCNCNPEGSWALTIAGFNGGVVIYTPGVSILHPFGQVYRAGPNVLGLKAGLMSCVYGACGTPAVNVLPGLSVLMIGTSL